MTFNGRKVAAYTVLSVYSAIGLVGAAGLLKYALTSERDAWTGAVLVVMSVAFSVLRVPMGNNMVSLGSIVSFFSIPLVGTWPSVGMKFLGIVVGGMMSRTKPLPQALLSIVATAGILSVATLAGGHVYLAVGGVSSSAALTSVASDVYPYGVMVVAYLIANVVALAIWQALGRRKDFVESAVETFRGFWFNHLVLAITGFLSLMLIVQLHWWLGMAVVTGALIAVRFAFQLYADSKQVRSELASVLTEALKFKDPYTAEHSKRVAEFSVRIGRHLGLSDETLQKLYDSALLHDIGKIAVPDAVLVKPGPLDASEWKKMERHVDAGGEILEQSHHLKELAQFVVAHHTDFDASTRPEAVPIAARIISVADAFDAMTSDRPYRKALPIEEAIRRLREGAGTQFDPQIVEALLRSLIAPEVAPPMPRGPQNPIDPSGHTPNPSADTAATPPGGPTSPTGGAALLAWARLRLRGV